MNPHVYEIINNILKVFPDQYGKIYQKLLGLTMEDLGFTIQERSIQGVDLHIARGDEKYALEVKTTQNVEITLGEKDVEGVVEREAEGYIPGFAALRLGLLAEWVIASADNISTGQIPIPLLESQAFIDLQQEVRDSFEPVVLKYGKDLVNLEPRNPQLWLDERMDRPF